MTSIDGKEFDSVDANDAKISGNYRSIVRRIGSTLPLSSTQRPRFELLPNGPRLIDTEQRSLFTLTDIGQLIDIPIVRITNSKSSNNLKSDADGCKTANSSGMFTTSSMSSLPQDDMVTKISALEDELSQLRSQIAMLVSNQSKQQDTLSTSFGSTLSGGAGEPASCSTPIKSVPPPPPGFIPPPPPPPPPPSNVPHPPQESVMDLIRRRKQEKAKNMTEEKPKPVLSMSDVLKDLHKVKLKSVSRSPNGTPMNKKPKVVKPADPAEFIAAALRKKFAHRQNNSPGSPSDLGLKRTPIRDREWEDSPPKFGQHLLKKSNIVPAS